MSLYEKNTRMLKQFGQARSFDLIGQQLNIVTQKIMSNDLLVKLLYKTERNVMSPEIVVDDAEKINLIKDNYITLVPYIPKEDEVKSYLIITFDDFTPTPETPRAMDYIMTVDILCHRDLWITNNLCPRPYLIMNELYKEFHGAKLDTWGAAHFVNSSSILMNDHYMGFTMSFSLSALPHEKKVEVDG